MTLDEAMRSLESRGPLDGDWRPWRTARAEAVQLLDGLPPEGLERLIPRLRRVCLGTTDEESHRAAALTMVRWCVERGEFGEVRTLASQMRFNRPLFDALGMAKVPIWTVVEALIPRNDPPLENLLTQLVHREPEYFGRLASLAPELAARVAGQLALWKQMSLAPFAGTLWSIYVGGTPAAGQALKQAAAQATPLSELLPKMEARLSEASGEEAALLAWVITLEQLKQGSELELLQAPRPEVRRAALEALGTKYAAHWERFLLAVAASDDEAMLELARVGIEEGLPSTRPWEGGSPVGQRFCPSWPRTIPRCGRSWDCRR